MSITLQFTFEVDGVLTDVTSAVLSDSTGAYGVKRDDTDAVVVADGAVMSRTAAGTYEYEFTPPADGLSYTWAVEYVYAGQTYRDSYTYSDTTKVVTLTEVKDHLRINGTDEDTLLNRLIDAATGWCEKYQRRKYLTQTCVEKFDEFPAVIYPRYSPLIAVTSLQYINSAGTLTTLSSSAYHVDTTSVPGRIQPAYGYSWPGLRGEPNAVTLIYTAGYGTAAEDVPEEIRAALLLLVGHLYRNREGTTEIALSQIPMGIKSLLGLERLAIV